MLFRKRYQRVVVNPEFWIELISKGGKWRLIYSRHRFDISDAEKELDRNLSAISDIYSRCTDIFYCPFQPFKDHPILFMDIL